MKRIVTLFFAFLISFSAFAQVKNAVLKHHYVSEKYIVDDGSSTNIPPPYLDPKDIEVITLSTSGNAWSTQEAQANQVLFNDGLNTVIHGHRSETPNTNHLFLDYSTDGGLNWTTDVDITPSAGASSSMVRYPQVTIVNHDGSTPQIVGCGWDIPTYKFMTTIANMDGSGASDLFDALSTTGHDYGVPTGLCADSDGSKAYASVATSNAGFKTDTICFLDADIGAGTVTWNETLVNLNLTPSHTYDFIFSKDMAFSKVTPGLGYSVLTCCDGANQFPDDIQPGLHIWKTTDAGANWTRLPAYDFTTLQLFQDSLVADDGQPIRPFFSDFSITVDANDNLHIMVQTYSGSDNTFSYWVNPEPETGSYNNHIFDLITVDGTSFEAVYVAPFTCNSYEYWPGEGAYQGTYMETVLSQDNLKLFFVWSETIDETENEAPDIKASPMIIADKVVGDAKVLTLGTDAETASYFAFTSHAAIESGTDEDYQIPIVYCEPGVTDLDPIQYYYISGVGLSASDFPGGVSDLNEINFEIYPNPAIDIITITNVKNSNISVFNITGAEVISIENDDNTVNIDLSDLSNGTYFVKVKNEEGSSTQKIVVLK